MKKYPKILQADKRGQIVIPKDIRQDLGIEEGCGFWAYTVTDEGILIKKIDVPELNDHQDILDEIEEKADKVNVDPKNIAKSKQRYKKTKQGNLELL